jgi:probable HAF family extracellular repeat protein
MDALDDERSGAAMPIRPLARSLLIPALLCLVAAARADVTVTDLGALPGGSSSRGYGINGAGQVVGEADTMWGVSRAVLSDAQGGLTDQGTLPGGWSSVGLGLNAHGDVVGRSQGLIPGRGMVNRAFLATESRGPVELGGLTQTGWSEARGINDAGLIVGMARDAAGLARAVFWEQPGVTRLLDSLVSTGPSEAHAVNGAGQVVGVAQAASGVLTAFRTAAGVGTMKDLGSLVPRGSSEARAINDAGAVTGAASSAGGGMQAFLYTDERGMESLHGVLFRGSSIGLGINAKQEVVGRLDLAGGTTSAFYWSRGTGMVDLNSLLDPASGWRLLSATGINNSGQITGFGIREGRVRGFVLSPTGFGGEPPATAAIPEPASAALLATGAALLAAARLRNRQRAAGS